MLNDILDLSRIEAGQIKFEAIAFDPAQLINQTLTLFQATAANRDLHLGERWSGPSGRSFCSDSMRLRQMLSNLIGNAIKFTSRGHVLIEGCVVDSDDAGATLEFSVSDSGVGIPADKLDLLFRPFSQTDSSTTREFGGSGLGLSIVRGLGTMMSGDVGVSSEPSKGSSFWFRIRVGVVAGTGPLQRAWRRQCASRSAVRYWSSRTTRSTAR